MIEKNEAATNVPKALLDLVEARQVELRYGEGEEEIVINVAPIASASAKIEAVILAADLLFGEGQGVDSYMPSFKTFARKYGVLICYTDIMKYLPKDLDNLWEIITATRIYDDVAEIVGVDEIRDFCYELDELIKLRLAAITKSTGFDSILDKISGLFSGFGEQFKDLDLSKIAKMFLDNEVMGNAKKRRNNI